MDHLPLPEGAKPLFEIPYYCPNTSLDWYVGPFETYPARMGWSEDNLRAHVPPHSDAPPFGRDSKGMERQPEDIERFFQTWLFFGTVIEVLKLGGVSTSTSDFLQPKGPTAARVVSTEKLPYLLTLWSPATGSNKTENQVLYDKIDRILRKALFYLNLFCQQPRDRHPSDRRKTPTWPVRDEISTSIIALVFALFGAAEKKFDLGIDPPSKKNFFARSATLYKRLERKWCLSDATRAEDEMEIDGHYFLAASPGLSEKDLDNHINCTRDRCHYEYDEKMYITKHAPPHWHKVNCKPAIWGGQFGGKQKLGKAKDWIDSVCKLIKVDVIPIALWDPSGDLRTVEYHKEPGSKLKPPYVAISHVWADGKGNQDGNFLPECQVMRIADMVARVRYKGRKPYVAPPNSDGTGFWMDTLCIPKAEDDTELRELKKKAIAGMRDVYAEASCVLILDECLMALPSTAPAPVILARMYQSSWIKRLWTHQEGYFPKELFVQFSDQSMNIDNLVQMMRDYEKNMYAKGIFVKFQQVAGERFALQYTFFKWSYQDINQKPKDLWKLYKPLTHIMVNRQTTRKADECVCLSTILRLDVKPFLDIRGNSDSDSAEKRMHLLLKTINKFDTGIIFNNWDRIQWPGFGWAPRTLLEHREGLNYWEIGSNRTVFEEIQWNKDGTPAGLPVAFPGFSSFDFSQARRKSISCADRAFAIRPGPGSVKYPWDGPWPLYIVEVFLNEVQWVYDRQYYIILSEIPEPHSDEGVVAVIGDAGTRGQNVNTFRHRCLARVRTVRDDEATEWIDIVTANVLSSTTKWLAI